MTILRYGNTNTFFIEGNDGGLLVDTDYAGTLPAFYKALKQNGIKVNNIKYVLATHYHPDHMGLISDLISQTVFLQETGFRIHQSMRAWELSSHVLKAGSSCYGRAFPVR